MVLNPDWKNPGIPQKDIYHHSMAKYIEYR